MIDSFKPINPALIDHFDPKHDGYPDALAAEDTFDVLWECCGSASTEFPKALWLDAGSPREDKARENDKHKTWGINYLDRFTNQTPTHECTCHMLRAEAEACRNRQRGIIFPDGPKLNFRYPESSLGSVWLSPLSVYAEANPAKRGGANCRQVLEIACRRGFLPETVQPRDYKFQHAMVGTTGKGGLNQASGKWVPLSQFQERWTDTARWFRPLEVIFTRDWEEALCLLLWGYVLGYGRNGHAIPPAMWNVASNAFGYPDSYDVVRWDSLSTFRRAVSSGVHCIASMPAPDNWLEPAGAVAL